MRKRISEGAGRVWRSLTTTLSIAAPDSTVEPDLSRRLILTGVAAVACTAVVSALPSPAAAQGIEFYFGGGHSRLRSYDYHSRRRSYEDEHSRRRSRRDHSRRRSSSHGRERSRREYRGWNEDCVMTPFGWVCF